MSNKYSLVDGWCVCMCVDRHRYGKTSFSSEMALAHLIFSVPFHFSHPHSHSLSLTHISYTRSLGRIIMYTVVFVSTSSFHTFSPNVFLL